MKIFLLYGLLILALSQNIGTFKPDYHINSSYKECTQQGCTTKQGGVTMAAEWRWLHHVGDYNSCTSGPDWNSQYCPNPTSCAQNCGYEGVSGADEYKKTYGVLEVEGGVRLNYVTKHDDGGENVGSRAYFLESENKYKLFKLANRQFSFDVDLSTLECGMNGAIYLVEMDEDGGSSKYPSNKAGAKYGTGYCDAQCPKTPFIAGQATSSKWGNYGACCPEFDLWEANKQAHVYTAHPCSVPGYYRCSGTGECGFDDQRYNGVCDKDGCGLNPFRNGNKQFYGAGSNFNVDTTKPFSVVTQFLTADGTDLGDVNEIRRFYVQNGKKIDFPRANVSGMSNFDSISNQNCQAHMSKFGDSNKFLTAGAMKGMGEALKRGMVLVLSLWDDYSSHMKWLDGTFPPNADPNTPGVMKGPCSRESGDPNDLRKNHPNSYITLTNIKVGTIGSTHVFDGEGNEQKGNEQLRVEDK